jgi:hypothetical protein
MSRLRIILATCLLALAVVSVAHASPAVLEPPLIEGDPVVGATLTAGGLVLEGAEADDAFLQWERVDGGGEAEPIEGAHDADYRPTTADVGLRLRVRVEVETADGRAEAASATTAAVRPAAVRSDGGVGPAPNALGASLQRWTAVAGERLAVRGRVVDAERVALVLEPTLAAYGALRVEEPLHVEVDGHLRGAVAPLVNSDAWVVVERADGEVERHRIGLVGVRPRIALRLVATPDGRAADGRRLVRDLRVAHGSAVEPGIGGLRLAWEGILPGEREGTAACRTSERVASAADGRLRGSCATRGAWSSARWRLAFDPGTDDPRATPLLAGSSAWRRPALRQRAIPVLPRACATLSTWSSPTSSASSSRPCRAAAPWSPTSWAPAATTSPSASSASSSPASR